MQKSLLKRQALVLAAATATLLDTGIDVAGIDVLSVQVKNVGANPLTGFEFRARVTKDAAFETIKSGTFTTPGAISLFASVEPATLAAAATSIMLFDVSAFDAVQLRATSTLGTTLDVFAGGGK